MNEARFQIEDVVNYKRITIIINQISINLGLFTEQEIETLVKDLTRPQAPTQSPSHVAHPRTENHWKKALGSQPSVDETTS
jgi:hypothetical protein